MSVFATTAVLTAATWTPLSTMAADGTVNVSLSNASGSTATVQVAISATPTGAPTAAEIMSSGQQLLANQVLKLMGEPIKSGETVKVYSSVTGVAARSSGFTRP